MSDEDDDKSHLQIMRKLGWHILLYHEDRLVGAIKGLDSLS